MGMSTEDRKGLMHPAFLVMARGGLSDAQNGRLTREAGRNRCTYGFRSVFNHLAHHEMDCKAR